jgi:membrane protease YdiL (CAAX protease family)
VSLAVVGPVEELLFRGVVQGGVRRAFDAVPAVLIASLAFGLIHLPSVSGTPVERWAYVGVVVVLGSVLGALYEWTDNVVVPGLAHGVYNAAIYVVLLAQAL